ncbi:MAG TPA: GNAT family N-acetyltransferase [Actinomycetota bacterium]|nr:GNAT family N-acetyltransferase [Actinomycetota bacterium]
MAGTAAPGGRIGPSDPWELARGAARAAGVELRPLTSLEDADAIIDVMIATWGEHQLLPREVIRALAESGNVPYGAVAEGQLVGYVLGWVGVGPAGERHVHSHMLAVRPGLRSKGVGYALKLAQRAQALDAGIGVVRWTYDPLQARNAKFNFCKLGVVADRFIPNCYGEMTDLLNRGDRSDRFLVRWDLGRRPAGRPMVPGPERELLVARGPREAPEPVRVADPTPEAEGSWRVDIPGDLPGLRERDPGLLRAWRDATAEAFEACLGMGMVVAAFSPGGRSGLPFYHLALPPAIVDRPDASA